MIEALYHYLRGYLSGQLQYLILYVTPYCNSRCKMCFSWRGMEKRKKGAPELSLEEIELLSRHSPAVGQLTMSGGEPMLRDDLPQICGAFYRNTHTRFFTIPTNCLTLGKFDGVVKSFFRECPRGYLNFCLPIDGLGDQHDEIRGVKGNFEKLLKSIEILSALQKSYPRLTFNLNTVLSSYNQDNIREIIDFVTDNYPEVPYGFALVRGDTRLPESKGVTPEIYRDACLHFNDRYDRLKRSLSPYPLVQKSLIRKIQEQVFSAAVSDHGVYTCRAGEKMAVIYDNGDVYPCEILDTKISCGLAGGVSSALLGNLRDSSFDLKSILGSDKARELISAIRASRCSCTWECAVFNSITSRPAGLARIIAGGLISGILRGGGDKPRKP